mmetsp:Transcript_21643/g.67077  ORF Transcript_21643/g.67077 Transcript_21643/m.67077 type:complete len:326 (-) Transcript_21643:210-1187(-)
MGVTRRARAVQRLRCSGPSAAAAARGASAGARAGEQLGGAAAAFENAIVRVEAPDELKVLAEARAVQHVPRVPADGEDLALVHRVVVVERPRLRVRLNRAEVDDGLAIVLAVGLEQVGQLEEAVGRRRELDVRHLLLELLVVDGDGRRLDQPRVGKADALREALKVIPVQRARYALAPQHLVLTQCLGHAARRVHVGEEELAARLEQPVHLLEHARLVRAEVEHAVGNDHVDGGGLELKLVKLLDVARQEARILLAEAKLCAVPLLGAARNLELRIGHVDADALARLADELREHVHVAPRAAAEVEHALPLQLVGRDDAAAVVLH